MLESISNYPKLWRATIVFRIEVALLTLQAIYGIVKFGIVIYHLRQWEDWMDKKAATDYWTIIGIVVLISLIYLAQVAVAFVLYKGIERKDFKKLAVWAMIQSGLLLFRIVEVILEISDRQSIGTLAIIVACLLIFYRVAAIKVVFDAIKELRKFPMTAPFVNMRDCEDRV